MPRRKRPHSKPIPVRNESRLQMFLHYVKGHRVYPFNSTRQKDRDYDKKFLVLAPRGLNPDGSHKHEDD